MFEDLSYALIGGLPVIVYLGVLTLILAVIAMSIGGLHIRRKIKLSVKWHFWFAYLAIIVGLIHGVLGLLAYV